MKNSQLKTHDLYLTYYILCSLYINFDRTMYVPFMRYNLLKVLLPLFDL